MRFINFISIVLRRGFANLAQSNLLQELVIKETQSVQMSKRIG
ncbi:hypothetical protein [Thalassotalea sp. PLHSN55]